MGVTVFSHSSAGSSFALSIESWICVQQIESTDALLFLACLSQPSNNNQSAVISHNMSSLIQIFLAFFVIEVVARAHFLCDSMR